MRLIRKPNQSAFRCANPLCSNLCLGSYLEMASPKVSFKNTFHSRKYACQANTEKSSVGIDQSKRRLKFQKSI